MHFAPDNEGVYYDRGLAKKRLNRFDEARQDLETALKLAQQSDNTNLIRNIKQVLWRSFSTMTLS
ncbi:MAG: tetratricopeptide repeat protein [Candidatus Poribacteria bacterium]|nr:tetratricopeptide repeat protein [Candidatus Poribacteria bacterium]